MNNLSFIRWDTIVSNADELYFDSMDHGNKIQFKFRDNLNNEYCIECKDVLCYSVSDEEVLLPYLNILKDQKLGNTLLIIGSDLINRINILNPQTKYNHYLLLTFDYCLEIVSNSEPFIFKA